MPLIKFITATITAKHSIRNNLFLDSEIRGKVALPVGLAVDLGKICATMGDSRIECKEFVFEFFHPRQDKASTYFSLVNGNAVKLPQSLIERTIQQ